MQRLVQNRAGFTLSGALFRKKVRALLQLENLATFFSVSESAVSSPETLVNFFCSLLSLFTRGLPIISVFRACKKFATAFVGPPFCGGPVRPNMLNMPISAAGTE